MINVIIVDDHELFRLGVRNALVCKCDDIRVTGEAATGKELFALLQHSKPDIVLLDIILPDMSGVSVAKKVKIEHPEIKILALSAENSPAVIRRMLDAGIEGFISKRMGSMSVLADTVRSVMNGEKFYGKDICDIIYQLFTAKEDNTKKTFTTQEKNIIELCRQGMTSKQIGEKLYISPRTVDNHKNNIFRKLGINNTMEMVQYALEKGIIG